MPLTVTCIGAEGVGKTQLINRWQNDMFEESYESTQGGAFHSKETSGITVHDKEQPLKLWDTGGAERNINLLPTYYGKSDIIVLVFDVTNDGSFKYVQDFVERTSKERVHSLKEGARFVLVANKIDLVEKRKVSTEEVEAFADKINAPYVETSAKEGKGLTSRLNAQLATIAKDILPQETQAEQNEVSILPLKQAAKEKYDALCSQEGMTPREKMIAVLKNYVDGDSKHFKGGFGRFFSGHWNRHNITAVKQILTKLNVEENESSYSMQDAYNALADTPKREGGSLSLRLDYIKNNILADAQLTSSQESEVRRCFPIKP